ncbi:hypothetical protein FRZ03_37400 [Streptomyces misionensis]|uniref:Uncharacterized protein n=1 Tax=Streptomyces misionensis TaxID=67331 RepID=A0A5C6INC8_9ACTN|nr:hypothetical protein [Streptomyces misionensis]TWV30454.1 hypothetical protein FRZ03_37400 [Streptomyces misionensis]
MAAWVRVRLTSSGSDGAIYRWADDEGNGGWLHFAPANGSFRVCDGAGRAPVDAMSLHVATQDLQHRDEQCWRSFVQAAVGVWRAYQQHRSFPEVADRVFY